MVKIATTVYTEEDIVLQDEAKTVISIKSLPIKRLRIFMAKMEDLQKVETETQGTDVLFELAVICLTKSHPKLVEDRDALEDILDMPTVYKIIEVCGGVKLNDPNLLAAAQAMMVNQAGKD